MELPRTRDGFVVRKEDDDYFLVDTEGGNVFQINRTAALIFDFCREQKSFDALLAALSQGLREPAQEAEIRADIEATVKQMIELGICADA